MGIQVIGEKKRRRAERETGLQIDRLVRIDNNTWEARVLLGDGHAHLTINRHTWHVSVSNGPCWSTCSGSPRLAVVPAGIEFVPYEKELLTHLDRLTDTERQVLEDYCTWVGLHDLGECASCDAIRVVLGGRDFKIDGHVIVTQDRHLESGGTLRRGQRAKVIGLTYAIDTDQERLDGIGIQWHDQHGTHLMAISPDHVVPVPVA